MRILVAHNHYLLAGGEDSVFGSEVELLRHAGHTVETLALSNEAIKGRGARAATALLAPYNPFGRVKMARAIGEFRPDVVHVHNFFPQFSPAIFDACHSLGIPVVWTLHNFRVTCANAFLMRDGKVCTDCLGKVPFSAIRHRCYKDSLVGSTSLAAMIALHLARGTWVNKVDRFIALTNFARNLFIKAGLPAKKIVVKPNFTHDPRAGSGEGEGRREGVLFVGRLSSEKGVDILIDAWRDMNIPLTIIGDGPERAELEARAGQNVRFLGHRDRDFVQAAMRAAALLVVPSVWFEMFPMTVVEAMANGTPLVVSKIGALAEIVEDGVTGMHFEVGSSAGLARAVRAICEDRERLMLMGQSARKHYEAFLSPKVSLGNLEEIYREVACV